MPGITHIINDKIVIAYCYVQVILYLAANHQGLVIKPGLPIVQWASRYWTQKRPGTETGLWANPSPYIPFPATGRCKNAAINGSMQPVIRTTLVSRRHHASTQTSCQGWCRDTRIQYKLTETWWRCWYCKVQHERFTATVCIVRKVFRRFREMCKSKHNFKISK